MKSMLLVAAASLALTPLAFADSMSIVSTTEGVQPAKIVSSSAYYDFNPGKNKIVIKLLGKTCTLNSSGNPAGAGAGGGCNYTITINNSTATMGLTSNGHSCTIASELPSSCK